MTKQLVLMVDDELDNRVMMRYFLESWGYEVVLAENGEQALARVSEQRPALVLLDLEMPVMDGFETCHRLKESPDTEDIPVIMFTGLEATSDKVKGIRRGADDYVVKTVDPEEIQARIEMILRRAARFEQKATEQAAANGNATANDNAATNRPALSGSLKEKNLPEAFQLAMAYGDSGTLLLQDGEKVGRVYLVDGAPVHAEYDGQTGEDAFYALSFWKDGQFSYQVDEPNVNKTIHIQGHSLLMEAARRMDEWGLISSKIPNLDVVAHRIAGDVSDTIKFSTMDWKILSRVDSTLTIRELSAAAGTDPLDTARTVYGLLTAGVLAFELESVERDSFFDAVPELRDEPKSEEFELTALQWKLVAYIDGKRDLGTLTQIAGLSPRKVATALKALAELGIVRVGKPRPKGNGTPKASNGSAENGTAQVEAVTVARAEAPRTAQP